MRNVYFYFSHVKMKTKTLEIYKLKRLSFCLIIPFLLLFISCEKKTENIIEAEPTIETEENDSTPMLDYIEVFDDSIQDDADYYFDTLQDDSTSILDDFYITKDGKSLNGYDTEAFETPIIKYVNTGDGSKLNFRDAPVDGEKIGQLPNGTKLEILRYTKEKFTIDGISDVWCYISDCEDCPPCSGWVFGGYLSETEPARPYLKKDEIDFSILIGSWENDGYIVRITEDSFSLIMKESEGFRGTWTIRDDGTLSVLDASVPDDNDNSFTVEFKIQVCMPNRLLLIEDDGYVFDLHEMIVH